MIIKICTLNRLNRKADKSVSLTFTTMQEQTTNEMTALDALFQNDCVIAVKPFDSQFNDKEIEDIDAIDLDIYDHNKTQSQRLRAVLWRVHEHELGRQPSKEEFKEFYRIKTEAIIDHFKNKID